VVRGLAMQRVAVAERVVVVEAWRKVARLMSDAFATPREVAEAVEQAWGQYGLADGGRAGVLEAWEACVASSRVRLVRRAAHVRSEVAVEEVPAEIAELRRLQQPKVSAEREFRGRAHAADKEVEERIAHAGAPIVLRPLRNPPPGLREHLSRQGQSLLPPRVGGSVVGEVEGEVEGEVVGETGGEGGEKGVEEEWGGVWSGEGGGVVPRGCEGALDALERCDDEVVEALVRLVRGLAAGGAEGGATLDGMWDCALSGERGDMLQVMEVGVAEAAAQDASDAAETWLIAREIVGRNEHAGVAPHPRATAARMRALRLRGRDAEVPAVLDAHWTRRGRPGWQTLLESLRSVSPEDGLVRVDAILSSHAHVVLDEADRTDKVAATEAFLVADELHCLVAQAALRDATGAVHLLERAQRLGYTPPLGWEGKRCVGVVGGVVGGVEKYDALVRALYEVVVYACARGGASSQAWLVRDDAAARGVQVTEFMVEGLLRAAASVGRVSLAQEALEIWDAKALRKEAFSWLLEVARRDGAGVRALEWMQMQNTAPSRPAPQPLFQVHAGRAQRQWAEVVGDVETDAVALTVMACANVVARRTAAPIPSTYVELGAAEGQRGVRVDVPWSHDDTSEAAWERDEDVRSVLATPFSVGVDGVNAVWAVVALQLWPQTTTNRLAAVSATLRALQSAQLPLHRPIPQHVWDAATHIRSSSSSSSSSSASIPSQSPLEALLRCAREPHPESSGLIAELFRASSSSIAEFAIALDILDSMPSTSPPVSPPTSSQSVWDEVRTHGGVAKELLEASVRKERGPVGSAAAGTKSVTKLQIPRSERHWEGLVEAAVALHLPGWATALLSVAARQGARVSSGSHHAAVALAVRAERPALARTALAALRATDQATEPRTLELLADAARSERARRTGTQVVSDLAATVLADFVRDERDRRAHAHRLEVQEEEGEGEEEEEEEGDGEKKVSGKKLRELGQVGKSVKGEAEAKERKARRAIQMRSPEALASPPLAVQGGEREKRGGKGKTKKEDGDEVGKKGKKEVEVAVEKSGKEGGEEGKSVKKDKKKEKKESDLPAWAGWVTIAGMRKALEERGQVVEKAEQLEKAWLSKRLIEVDAELARDETAWTRLADPDKLTVPGMRAYLRMRDGEKLHRLANITRGELLHLIRGEALHAADKP
jgi:hypothetical protein